MNQKSNFLLIIRTGENIKKMLIFSTFSSSLKNKDKYIGAQLGQQQQPNQNPPMEGLLVA
jgi:hypothetical protein